MRHARGRAPQPRGGLEKAARRVLALILLVVAGVVLWGAAFSTAARHERSPVRMNLGRVAPFNDRR